MPGSTPRRAAGAVEIAEEFRDQLIIDRYDPLFASPRAGRRKRLHGAGLHDVVAWNVFRSLRQVASSVWLPELFLASFAEDDAPPSSHAIVSLWRTIAPPPTLLDETGEAEYEVDVLIDAPGWVWIIDTMDGHESQLLRTLDVGSHYAGVRAFYLSLLASDAEEGQAAAALVRDHRDPDRTRELLHASRPDGLPNLRGVSLLRWSDLGDVLADVSRAHATREDERPYALRALEWMRDRGIVAADPVDAG